MLLNLRLNNEIRSGYNKQVTDLNLRRSNFGTGVSVAHTHRRV